MYILSKLTKEKAEDLTNDILDQCKEKIDPIFSEIHNKYQNISQEDAMTIASYTCESKDYDYSPYRILNKNLISEDRKNGLKIISKYLYIFLCSLRKLPRYYPNKTKGYLYRCINKQINYMINPFKPKIIPYIQGNKKTFWGFTSTSPDIIMTYKFLGKKEKIKSGTIFSLFGDVWGYDITPFNVYKEEEILLEPERKFIVEQILPPANEIIYVRCKIENSPLVLNFLPCINTIQIQSLTNQVSNLNIIGVNNLSTISQSNQNILLREQKGTISTNKNINIKFFHSLESHFEQSQNELSDTLSPKLSNFLKLCVLKEIANKLNDNNIINLPPTLGIIIRTLKNNYIKQIDNTVNNIEDVLRNTGNNMVNFSSFISNEVKSEHINQLLAYLHLNEREEIREMINKLSKYEKDINLFNKEFYVALRNSLFEYSLVSATFVERNDFENFKKEREKCPNCADKLLFHGTIIRVIPHILTNNFIKAKNNHFGKGIYFTDQIDYCFFYGSLKGDTRSNLGKIPKKGDEFTMIACSTYYDQTQFRRVYDHEYNPNKNEINYALVEPSSETIINPKENDIYFTEYVISELGQICPFLGIKLKREEYCIIWRDIYFSAKTFNNNPHFENNKKIISKQLTNVEQYVNYNVYPCDSTEEALKLIKRKKFNKIILISNVGNYNEGKIFIDEARKLIGNDVITLFFVYDIKKHLEWITSYKNAFITNEANFLERYVKCFNGVTNEDILQGIMNLKNDWEKKYNIKLKFSEDFLNFPNYKESGNYSDLKL